MPAYVLRLCLFLAIYQGLHPVVVQAVWLDEVDDVKLVDLILSSVGDAEVEPLAELGGRAMVKLEIEVVFKFIDLSRSVQIAALESRLKDQCAVR